MMRVDWIVLGVIGLFGLLGLISGALRQLAQWIGLAAGYGAAYGLRGAAASILSARLGLSGAAGQVATSVVLFYGAYGLASLLSHLVLEKIFAGREKDIGDRAAGFALGAGKAAVAAFVLLSALLFFEQPLARAVPLFSRETAGSQVFAFVRAHNLFASLHVGALEGARRMIEAAENPRAASALASNPAFQALLADPRLKSALSNSQAADAVRKGDLSAALADPKLMELFNDPKTAELLKNIGAAPDAQR